ncbi:Shikimate dehydrogenase (NADP(+)) [Buchnera aphidicola (Cinara pseudotaxifoliae)]|uniref:shikimate dehydrogenase (NADP(+)) n=1 Tax=Buchnera aphidicola (Cinara pseudotaxifoliae) TaxID=655384 RepID=A0A451DHL9_9GAMM|nr:shikimate dehydrogenase [Buchnera aphidicola]VFP86132.1 Shikimate dehydrogenase (NADP(+)) [Buchnera aphidicola (Cinara pseudotaxifoliae)]
MYFKNVKNKKIIALFGNPVSHSLSPAIHKNFSKEIKINYHYNSFLCKKSNFFSTVKKFFNTGGLGCNITVPFKRISFDIPHQHTKIVKISGSINVLTKISNNNIIGDNTDGIGLIYDLKRLGYIKKNCTVLLLGSGGVAYSVVYHLLKKKCSVCILNRTISCASNLVDTFKHFGDIFIFSDDMKNYSFDLIINATSCSIYNTSPVFPKNLVGSRTKCYDISYSTTNTLTPFLYLCKILGSRYISDGLGMLVAQAAYSCYSWFKILPNIEKNINIIKNLNNTV